MDRIKRFVARYGLLTMTLAIAAAKPIMTSGIYWW